MKAQQCTICGERSIPGLIRGAGKCQYHYNLKQFGQEAADRARAEAQAKEQGSATC